MNSCKHCGHLEQETPQDCSICDSVMIWAKAQFGGLWSGYQRKRAEQLGMWMWHCPNDNEDWHKERDALLKWLEQCPDEEIKQEVSSQLEEVNFDE